MSGGAWETLETALGIVGVHAVVLHTGKVLYWCFDQRAVGLFGKDDDTFDELFNDPELGSYQIWDPVSKMATTPPKQIGRNSFCGGQCALADGTIFVAGGQDGAGAIEIACDVPKLIATILTGTWPFFIVDDSNLACAKLIGALFGTDNGAHRDVQTYDPISDTWQRWPDLQDGRYYPTCVTLDDGTAFIAGGLSNLQQWVISGARWCENDTFETVPNGLLFAGPTAPKPFHGADQYPMLCLLPGTRQLFVHIETKTSIFDLNKAAFVVGAEFHPPDKDVNGQPVGRQTYPMQTGHVLLPQMEGDPPRILVVGGSTAPDFNYNTQSDKPAVLGAFIFDFNASAPEQSKWRLTKNPPTVARLLADTVLLPDGTVFVVNGLAGGAAAGHSDRFPDPVMEAEIFDPSTEMFTAVTANPDKMHPRGYHSTAVLLPDARVAIAGNTDAYNPKEPNHHDDVSIQIYTPPYLDGVVAGTAQRPVVTNAPGQITYGSSITLDCSGGPDVARVMMMRPCAVTHTVDMDQRAVVLNVSGGSGTVTLSMPNDHSLAPPGYYMLFFIAADGTPSNASWVRLLDGTPTFPPLNLGTYEGDCVIDEVFDGDLFLEKIDQHCRVTLESRHGSITIKHKIDQWSYANLKAAGNVSIGEGIDQHSIVTIDAGGDVTIAQTINENATAKITAGGKIDIGLKVDNYSGAYLVAGTTVHVGQTLDQHSNVTISAGGDVAIDKKIDQHCTAIIESTGGAISIGEKVDQHAHADLTASGDVTIGQKLDAQSVSTIKSATGNINIGQGLSGGATGTLTALNGVINIGDSVDGGCTLNWSAKQLNCPHRDGTINHI